MLTFRFTGVNGEMIEEEMLAAGMVGKQVQFVFSEDWDGLRKVAVYKAGDACCTTVDVETVDTIPAEVLACSLQRLQVGIYGISEDGSVVTPTIYATGPFIHISAVLGEDPCFDPENTFWIRLEEAIGELTELSTEEKTSLVLAINENRTHIHALAADTAALAGESASVKADIVTLQAETAALAEDALRFSAQTLTEKQQAQARQNIGAVSAGELPAPGLDETSANLLLTILQNGVYTSDQSENILLLSAAVCGTVVHGIANVLENVTSDNSRSLLAEGDSYTAVLTAAEGYELDTVTVTMGGADITAEVYAEGVISIPAVTGEVVITATAAKVSSITVAAILQGTTSYITGSGLQLSAASNHLHRATVIPVGQYLEKGKTYRFSIGDAAPDYYFGVQIMTASEAGLTFPRVEGESVVYSGVTSRLVDTGWIQEDYEYTAQQDNLIFTMNFRNSANANLNTSEFALLMANVVIEEV